MPLRGQEVLSKGLSDSVAESHWKAWLAMIASYGQECALSCIAIGISIALIVGLPLGRVIGLHLGLED